MLHVGAVHVDAAGHRATARLVTDPSRDPVLPGFEGSEKEQADREKAEKVEQADRKKAEMAAMIAAAVPSGPNPQMNEKKRKATEALTPV